MIQIRTYTELCTIPDYISRFRYLVIGGRVGEDTFGWDRYLNQRLYQSIEWRRVRDHVIARDLGYDMGLEGYPIPGRIYIHHMNPIRKEDILLKKDEVMDPEFLICVSRDTHNAIHYGDESRLYIPKEIERSPNDTSPWKL